MQAITFNEFINGSYKEEKEKKSNKKRILKVVKRVGTSIAIPLVMAKPVFAPSD